MTEIEAQAQAVLMSLVTAPFAECAPITQDFAGLTTSPGLYAVRHRTEGLLYVGRTQDFRHRFSNGHKSMTWAWLADYDHRDVAISMHPLDFIQLRKLSSELETIILNISEPPFNARIPTRD